MTKSRGIAHRPGIKKNVKKRLPLKDRKGEFHYSMKPMAGAIGGTAIRRIPPVFRSASSGGAGPGEELGQRGICHRRPGTAGQRGPFSGGGKIQRLRTYDKALACRLEAREVFARLRPEWQERLCRDKYVNRMEIGLVDDCVRQEAQSVLDSIDRLLEQYLDIPQAKQGRRSVQIWREEHGMGQ